MLPNQLADIVRWFPGPAGTLPRLPGKNRRQYKWERQEERQEENMTSLSQTERTTFLDCVKAWSLVVKELGIDKKDQESLVNRHNIQWIKKNGGLCRKGHFLVCAIKAMHPADKDMKVVLCDNSGTIAGVVKSEIVEKFRYWLMQGTCLLLQNFNILNVGSKTFLLIVNENSLSKIFNIGKHGELVSVSLQQSINTLTKQKLEECEKGKFELEKKPTLVVPKPCDRDKNRQETEMKFIPCATSTPVERQPNNKKHKLTSPNGKNDKLSRQENCKRNAKELQAESIKKLLEDLDEDNLFGDF